MDDRAQVEKIRRGDREAFVALLDRYETKVYNLVYRTLPCRADVDDVAQEALIEIWKSLPGFRFESALSTWIYRVTMNVTMEHIRKCARSRGVQLNAPTEIDDEIQSIATNEAPENEFETMELKHVVDAALLKLPDEQRQVVVLHELNEMTYSEVAQVLGVPVGTVKSRLFHAMKKLREILERQMKQ